MSHGRIRRLCAVAIAAGAVAGAPGSAGAHPADCSGGRALTPTPTSERVTDWVAEDRCGKGAARVADSSGAGRATATARAGRSATTREATRAQVRPRQRGLRQVGHEPLLNRGMHAALAVHGDYAYVGSRTDRKEGKPEHGGIMVVDISEPSNPRLQGLPFDSKPGESSRELRVWRSQDVLIVLNTNCGTGPTTHYCTQRSISNIRFYDVAGANAAQPRLLHQLDVDTHEFFLWEDPENPERALMYGGNAASTCAIRGGAPSCPLAVWDISGVRDGQAPVTLFRGTHGYTRHPASPAPVQKPTGGLHSLTVSNDGTHAYYALLNGGFAVVDVSDFMRGMPSPQPRPITENTARPVWEGPGAHSAVKLWGRDWAWVSDEVYGSATAPDHGCPWGWARMIDIADARTPTVQADFRLPENDPATCAQWDPPRTSYSAHNPTLTPNLAITTWHSGGLQVVSLRNPRRPVPSAEFFPEPLAQVDLEDPRLASDPDTGRNEKVVMWSYPIIQDGLIYVVDLRNGLYVLRYRGAYEREVRRIDFLEGNSNQGDALCFEPVGRLPRGCRR